MVDSQPDEKKKGLQKSILIGLFVLVGLFLACILTVVLSGPVSDGLTRSAAQTRCAPASEELIIKIKLGIKNIEPGNDIGKVFIVKSKDFDGITMIAGAITGADIRPGEVIGVWAISGDPGNPGEVMSVDGFAKKYSNFAYASSFSEALAVSTEGAAEAFLCVQAALK